MFEFKFSILEAGAHRIIRLFVRKIIYESEIQINNTWAKSGELTLHTDEWRHLRERLELELDNHGRQIVRGTSTFFMPEFPPPGKIVIEYENEYRDDRYAERPCDRDGCKVNYRGPAVYCSKYCALLDA